MLSGELQLQQISQHAVEKTSECENTLESPGAWKEWEYMKSGAAQKSETLTLNVFAGERRIWILIYIRQSRNTTVQKYSATKKEITALLINTNRKVAALILYRINSAT